MYYYGFSKLIKKDKRWKGNIFSDIAAFLSSEECPMLNDSEQGNEDYDFFTGLQVAGLIAYSNKHLRADRFDKPHQRLFDKVIDQRLNHATQTNDPILLNAFELVSLKLLAIGLAKDQATNWVNINRAKFAIDSLEKVGKLLLTSTIKPKLSQLKLKE